MEQQDNLTGVEKLRALQARMSDQELITLARKELRNLCRTGGRSIKMTVPPNPRDTDMLISESLRRFEALNKKSNYGIDLEEFPYYKSLVKLLNTIDVSNYKIEYSYMDNYHAFTLPVNIDQDLGKNLNDHSIKSVRISSDIESITIDY